MRTPIRILELRSVWGTGGGPDKTILAGAARSDRRRFLVTVCYVRDARDRMFTIDRSAASLGVDYVEIIERHSLDPSIWWKLRRLVAERQIDIVHAHDHKTDALTWALGKRARIIPMSTAHGFSGSTVSERLYYAVEKRLLARFPRVIAVSSPIKAELARTGSRPECITVVNNGIDHRFFTRDASARSSTRTRLGLSGEAIVLGSVGRLEIEKRFDLLIDAFAAFHARHSSAALVIAGEGQLRTSLERQINRLGLAHCCRLIGQHSDIIRLHSAFDIYVQASEREGTPNAVLEAMALETPIVATNVGGTTELVAHSVHGLIVPPHSTSALDAALETLVSDWPAARIRAQAARARVEEELSFDRRMEKVEGIYEDLMAGRVTTL